jgi:hypothetical protein
MGVRRDERIACSWKILSNLSTHLGYGCIAHALDALTAWPSTRSAALERIAVAKRETAHKSVLQPPVYPIPCKPAAFAGGHSGEATVRSAHCQASLSEGATEADLLEAYPHLAHEDIQAAIAYAADAVSREKQTPVKKIAPSAV